MAQHQVLKSRRAGAGAQRLRFLAAAMGRASKPQESKSAARRARGWPARSALLGLCLSVGARSTRQAGDARRGTTQEMPKRRLDSDCLVVIVDRSISERHSMVIERAKYKRAWLPQTRSHTRVDMIASMRVVPVLKQGRVVECILPCLLLNRDCGTTRHPHAPAPSATRHVACKV